MYIGLEETILARSTLYLEKIKCTLCLHIAAKILKTKTTNP